jgi:uncharacterized membrane-anchored protein
MDPGRVAVLIGGLAVLGGAPARAQPADPAPDPPSDWQGGPRQIALGHALTLALPEGFGFLPRDPAVKWMERQGNLSNDDLLGVVAQRDSDWLIVLAYEDDGHVPDDEAGKLDADAILAELRDGTEEANRARAEKGFPPLQVVGWTEPPRYEPAAHRLVWGVEARGEGGPVVNFKTRVLGRRGFASLNLVGSTEGVAQGKPAAEQLLAATRFEPGAGYADFEAGKDQVAEYGLSALVAGGAGAAALKAVKVGLLAKFGAKLLAVAVAAKKAVLAAVVALWALLRRRLGRLAPGKAAPPPSTEP